MSAMKSTMPDTFQVEYGKERIEFTLIRRERKTMSITVHPDLRVEVVAPRNAEEARILAKVKKRGPWILRQRRTFMAWMPKPSPRNYQSGETHRYLGRQYRLKVLQGVPIAVKLRGAFIEIKVKDSADKALVKRALDRWYRQHAKIRFQQQLAQAYQHLSAYKLPEPKLRILKMPKRWGSCTAEGEIILNPELIKAPSMCIEYVIVHELCHLRHPNHSKAFFQMLDAALPDWKARKTRLEQLEV